MPFRNEQELLVETSCRGIQKSMTTEITHVRSMRMHIICTIISMDSLYLILLANQIPRRQQTLNHECFSICSKAMKLLHKMPSRNSYARGMEDLKNEKSKNLEILLHVKLKYNADRVAS